MVSIHRIHSSTGKDVCRIALKDARSGIEFAAVDLSLVAFAKAVLGMSEIVAEITVKGLPYVGKYKERKAAHIQLSKAKLKRLGISEYSREELEAYLEQRCQRDGWILSPYLGSQHSIAYDQSGSVTLHFSYYRYVRKSKRSVLK